MSVRASVTLTLDAAAVRTWSERAEQWLGERRAELDQLNVFPVADSDTGTNLYLTFVDAAEALRAGAGSAARGSAAAGPGAPGATADEAARLFARGALIGARGNSGVIVGQYVGALVQELVGPAAEPGRQVTPARLVTGLRTAADAAYAAVAAPVEGTVLTVARSVVDGARRAALAPGPPGGALAVLEHGIEQGYVALGRTTDQLAALRAAGVLDAGAWGLLIVLDALAAAGGSTTAAVRVHGQPSAARSGQASHSRGTSGAGTPSSAVVDRDADLAADPGVRPSPVGPHRTAPGSGPAGAHGGGEFEVMYLVAAGGGTDLAPGLRAGLSRVGESVAVVGGDGLWQAHVHTDHPLAAIAVPASLAVQPSQVRIRHLLSQSGVHGSHRPRLGLVAVTRAPGLVPDLARAGAVVVLLPSAGAVGPELARAVADTGARQVLVLSSVRLSERARRGTALRVLDGLAEVQVAAGAATVASGAGIGDPAALLDEVTRAVGAVRTAVVPGPAARRDVGDPRRDVGGARQAEAMLAVARPLLGTGAALLTVLTSASTDVVGVDALRAGLAASHPQVEVVVLDSGRPGTGVELGAE